MRYIKLYEVYEDDRELANYENDNYHSGTDKRYWLVPTDERFEMCLNQIGCLKNYKESFLDNNHILNEGVVFIGFRYDDDGDEYWGWNIYYGKYYCDDYEASHYKFLGLVNMNDYEPDILKTAKKYNL